MKVVIAQGYEYARDFLSSVPSLFLKKEGRALHEGRNEVRLFNVNGTPLVVKRYKRVNFIQRIVYSFFRATKAERAYRFAGILRQRGIATPHEVAYMEQRERGLFSIGYFVSLECTAPSLYHPLDVQDVFDRALAKALARFIVCLHQKGVLHGDMNFGNFLYHWQEDGICHFSVIDTNRSHFRDSWPSREECLSNFQTMTHRREVYEFIVREYAVLRNWDVEQTVTDAFHYLDMFEQRHQRKEKFIKHLKKL